MQVFFDFLPVIAFVGAYWLTDMRTAIAVIMAAVTLQVLITWLVRREVSKMLLASASLVVVLGGLSLLIDNDLVFKWKPTVLNWVFAAVFLGSQFYGDRPVIQRLIESVSEDELKLSADRWRRLNQMWVGFFTVSGAANLFVAYRYSEAFWVNFKLFGLLGMTLVFVLIQALWLSRQLPDDAQPGGGSR